MRPDTPAATVFVLGALMSFERRDSNLDIAFQICAHGKKSAVPNIWQTMNNFYYCVAIFISTLAPFSPQFSQPPPPFLSTHPPLFPRMMLTLEDGERCCQQQSFQSCLAINN